ncbi:calcium-binding EGF-like domain-containing protein [Aureispira sp. CCB-QB1]|uniref:calcium-binding EGF-like domain-containing protein n=1 Tax=Aureispira sp. CCB-QB1 TaxID=1313421 RepID=UPI0006985CFC|nr:calcium-binding EGF-like domain-containing protein [Aureispira sp. CCB-QB1]
MKNLFLALLPLLFVATVFSSCQKDPVTAPDPCANISCFNGGVCQNGTCDCPPGFSGAQCQIADPCHNITCLNGGTCVNGNCDCPPGYGGSDCGTALTPVSMTITSVTVTNYPATKPSGSGWDLTTGPDCFLTINSGTSANQNSFVSGYTYNNVAAGTQMPFNTGFPISLTSPNSDYVLAIWDNDAPDADDYMDGFRFIPNNYSSGFPSTLSLSTATFAVTIDVTWNF